MSASELETAATRILADPADADGRAGRTVIEGAAVRPAAEVEAGDAIAQRGTRSKATRSLPAGRRMGWLPDR